MEREKKKHSKDRGTPEVRMVLNTLLFHLNRRFGIRVRARAAPDIQILLPFPHRILFLSPLLRGLQDAKSFEVVKVDKEKGRLKTTRL